MRGGDTTPPMTQLDGWSLFSFTHDGLTRDIYRRGEGPGVVVMHEIPGITPAVESFARRVADAGYTVFMPHLFGTPGKQMTPAYAAQEMARAACIRREFNVFASRGSSAVTRFLRGLCYALHQEVGGPGVGAVGMCLTGNFALSLMVDPWLMAPVLSQPSLPANNKHGLHVSDEDLVVIRRRAREGAGVLGLRFTHDPLCPRERFARLENELGEGFEGIEIDSSRGNPYGLGPLAHSVLTEELVDEEGHPTRAALDRVMAVFQERLKPA